MSEINNGEMGVIVEKDPIITLQHNNSKNKPLKKFISEMREKVLTDFDFLVVYGFDIEHKKDLRLES